MPVITIFAADECLPVRVVERIEQTQSGLRRRFDIYCNGSGPTDDDELRAGRHDDPHGARSAKVEAERNGD